MPVHPTRRSIPACTLILSLCLLPFLASAAEEAWTPLFDGKTLDGWSVKCQPKDADTHFWSVQDGTIQADSLDHKGHDYVWLYSDREYSDFRLRLKFQAFRSSPGNTGVQIRSRYDDSTFWLNGPQIDVHPTGPWRTGMIWDETRGVQCWLYPPVPKGEWVDPSMAVKGITFYFSEDEPAWNTLEISAVGPRIQAHLNGVKVTDFDGSNVLDDEPHRTAGTGKKGHIALQIHSGDQLKVRFKDIEILEQ